MTIVLLKGQWLQSRLSLLPCTHILLLVWPLGVFQAQLGTRLDPVPWGLNRLQGPSKESAQPSTTNPME